MAQPRFQRARAFKFLHYTTGNINLTVNTNWTNVNTGLDMAIEAQVGDVLEYSINGLVDTGAGSAGLDVATIVSAAPVNSFANAGAVTTAPPPYGVQGWPILASTSHEVSGSAFYTVVSGDISSGTVTVRLRYQAAGSKTLYASTNNPLQVAVKNLGPVDPE